MSKYTNFNACDWKIINKLFIKIKNDRYINNENNHKIYTNLLYFKISYYIL
jgi:hypothetical protein